MQPYYEKDGITIYHADALDVMPCLGRHYVNLVLTDPPYAVGKAYWDTGEFSLEWAKLTDAPLLAVMPGIANLPRLPLRIADRDYKWTFAIHVSNGMTRSPVGYGNWIACSLWVRDGIKFYAQKSDVGRIAVSGPKPDHPSPKPIQAMEWLVGRLPGEVILDPFMGAGTTLLAALRAKRTCIGIETEEKYCEEAVRRLERG